MLFRSIIRNLNRANFDRVVVFGVQLSFLLRRHLIKYYRNKYVVDIRDYNRLLSIVSIKKIISNSFFTTISSIGFQEWLPISDKYVVNHNIKSSYLKESCYTRLCRGHLENKIRLSYIGSIRDVEVNIKLIDDLCGSKNVLLEYHGNGIASSILQRFVDKKNVRNISITGRYTKEQEEIYYERSDLINILISSKGINNKTLLTNRLYQAVIFGKPILTIKGSYQASLIEEFNLGIVVDDVTNIETAIFNYLKSFNVAVYNDGRERFFSKVMQENRLFEKKIVSFVEED